MKSKYLSYLKKFDYLEEIVIKDSYINCFLQISKLEALPYLKHLTIKNNPICQCAHLIYFIVYRFPNLDYVPNDGWTHQPPHPVYAVVSERP